jgi:DNA-binding PadR family transcriptional regulator
MENIKMDFTRHSHRNHRGHPHSREFAQHRSRDSHHFGHEWGRERGERGGGRRRVFDSGDLRLVLLKLIADQPRHGYDLIRAIEEASGGSYVPSPGVIYPALSMLQDLGHIVEVASEGARKAFAVTEQGKVDLAANADKVESQMARLAAIATMRERTDGGPVRRAMENLKVALRGRLGGSDSDQAIVHDIAAILDEAAQRIERL